jgi:hypothetical protein
MSAASTEVATPTSTEVATISPEAEALIAQQAGEFGDDTLQVPILKVGQALTKEVQDDTAEAGEFINTLTGEGIGNEIGFIVAYYQKGRSAADRETGRYYVAFGDTIPEAWADLVGEEFVGERFDEYPDAEEKFKERVNNKEIEWGKGPLISTTHNYTGLAVVSTLEGSDEEFELQPVRLSLQRTQMEAVRKINSLYRMTLRGKPFWDKVFDLTTYKKSFPSGPAYIVKPSIGRDTTVEERQIASELALATAGGRVTERGGDGDAPAKPKAAKGALEV